MEREAPGDWLARTMRDTQSRLEKISEMRDEIAGINGTAESPGGEVRVTAAPSGIIRTLELSRTAYRLPPEDLAELIVETIRRATADGAAALTEKLQPVAGDRVDIAARLRDFDGPDATTLDAARASLRNSAREMGDPRAGWGGAR